MADTDRAQAQHLSYLAGLANEIRHYGLFPLVRGAEARAQHLPKVGTARLPSQNIVDLAQEPVLGFAASTMAKVRQRGGRTRLSGYWLGLTGPMGPLPTHITEYVHYEKRYAKSQPFGDWLDMIAGRMLQLFYRAWADSQPAAMADRPGEDQFAAFLSALSGAMEGADEHSAFPARARVHYAALFASRRSAVAIEDGLSHLLGQPVTLHEFQPRWRTFEPQDRSRLGSAFASLGRDAFLGARVRSAADAVRLVIRVEDFHAYKSMLPTGGRFALAQEALDAFLPSHIEWDICLEIPDKAAPPARLDGRAMLGWSSWMKRKPVAGGQQDGDDIIRADAHLRKMNIYQGIRL